MCRYDRFLFNTVSIFVRFFFRPDAKSTIDEDHPLNALKRDRAAKNIAEMAANLPLDKLDKLESMLEQLENDQT